MIIGEPMIGPRKGHGYSAKQAGLLACIVLSIFFLLHHFLSTNDSSVFHYQLGSSGLYTTLHEDRTSDVNDSFESFRGRDTCGFSSTDLHLPFEPRCKDQSSLLNSMSDGGRPGFDAPYMPRGCDLKFYSTREICQILTRFESIIFLGDSLIRHLLGAFSILLRENLEYGAQQQWMDELYVVHVLVLSTPSPSPCLWKLI